VVLYGGSVSMFQSLFWWKWFGKPTDETTHSIFSSVSILVLVEVVREGKDDNKYHSCYIVSILVLVEVVREESLLYRVK